MMIFYKYDTALPAPLPQYQLTGFAERLSLFILLRYNWNRSLCINTNALIKISSLNDTIHSGFLYVIHLRVLLHYYHTFRQVKHIQVK